MSFKFDMPRIMNSKHVFSDEAKKRLSAQCEADEAVSNSGWFIPNVNFGNNDLTTITINVQGNAEFCAKAQSTVFESSITMLEDISSSLDGNQDNQTVSLNVNLTNKEGQSFVTGEFTSFAA